MKNLEPAVTSSFSAGVASYPGEAGSLDGLLTLAGHRLDNAKSRGRARIVTNGSAERATVEAASVQQ